MALQAVHQLTPNQSTDFGSVSYENRSYCKLEGRYTHNFLNPLKEHRYLCVAMLGAMIIPVIWNESARAFAQWSSPPWTPVPDCTSDKLFYIKMLKAANYFLKQWQGGEYG
jgi:hypothetical protein